MDLNQVVFMKFTLKQLLIAGGGIFAVFAVIGWIKKMFGKKEVVSPHRQTVQCSICGWQGQVSVHAGKCPKCSNPLGDQRAKKSAG